MRPIRYGLFRTMDDWLSTSEGKLLTIWLFRLALTAAVGAIILLILLSSPLSADELDDLKTRLVIEQGRAREGQAKIEAGRANFELGTLMVDQSQANIQLLQQKIAELERARQQKPEPKK